MFEPVAAAAADDPAILPLRMSVDQEMAVVAILILANPPFGERTAGEVRETPCKIGADVGERLVGHAPLAAVGIIARAMGVERELEPARFDIGKAMGEVGAADIDPGGEFAGRSDEGPGGKGRGRTG